MTDAVDHLTVREWPEGERPREKLATLGVEYLSDAELLAILVRVGTPGQDAVAFAMGMLASNDGLTGLSRMSMNDLTKIHGVGPGKATSIMATFEMGRRALMNNAGQRLQIHNGRDVAGLLEMRLRSLDKEELHVVLLTVKNHVMSIRRVYAGKINGAQVRPAEVFQDAIKENAASIILAHNHPSGDPNPSMDDVNVTRNIVAAGKLLDIDVIDHIIIGDTHHGWVSMRDRRLGFEPA